MPARRRTFTVDLHLGADDLPSDDYGPVTVNLASGNLSTAVGTPLFPAVGGDVGLTFAYNSKAKPTTNGLVGSYWVYNGAGIPTIPTSPPNLVRVDPTLDFEWAGTRPAPALPATNFAVRWEGKVTPPAAGKYRFGASASDGVRIVIGGQTVVERWEDQSSWVTPHYSTPIDFAVDGNGKVIGKDIRVEYYKSTKNDERDARSLLHLVVLGPTAVANTLEPTVPTSWLSHASGPLPTGWTMTPAGIDYSSTRLSESALTITDPSGANMSYRATGALGFEPLDDDDAIVTVDGTGLVTVHGNGSRTTTFNAWGTAETVSSPTDDRNVNRADTAIRYTWATPGADRPHLLVAIQDPYGALDGTGNVQAGVRQALLRYQGRDTCPEPSQAFKDEGGITTVPPNTLCQVKWWDNTTTDLFYRDDQLARIVNPGDEVTDFGYVSGRMETIRTPLQSDALANPQSGWPTKEASRTEISYNGSGKVQQVKLAVPVQNAERPGHRYGYTTAPFQEGGASEAEIYVDGLTPATIYVQHFDWGTDPAPTKAVYEGSRWQFKSDTAVTKRKATVKDANEIWSWTRSDWGGRPVESEDINNRKGGALYDTTSPAKNDTGRLKSAWGPLGTGGATGTTLSWDLDGPTQTIGLGGTWWNNEHQSGQPVAHSLTVGSNLIASLPPGVNTGYSARFTGEIDVTGPGDQQLKLLFQGYGRMYIDDKVVVDHWYADNGQIYTVDASQQFAPGRYRIRIDFRALSQSAELKLYQGNVAVPTSQLHPRYGNAASSIEADTTAGVTARRSDVEYKTGDTLGTAMTVSAGLATKSTQDPSGLALTSRTAYDSFGRVSATRMPAAGETGPATTYEYYTPTETSDACGVPNLRQAGMLKSITDPSPGNGDPARKKTFVYDDAGRLRGTELSNTGWSCIEYDARGRVKKETFPAFGSQLARTVDYTYAIGTNTLKRTVVDGAGTITMTVDLLGRLVAYLDVWGNAEPLANQPSQTTTYTYDRAGRLVTTKGPHGRIDTSYDDAGRTVQQWWNDDLNTEKAAAALVATATYNSSTAGAEKGMLASVSYGNGTRLPGGTAVLPYDGAGRLNKLEWSGPAGVLATDEVRYSLAGRVVDQRTDGTDAFPGTGSFGDTTSHNFIYDAVGRLTTARVPGPPGQPSIEFKYGFDDGASCAVAPSAGKNTNRMKLEVTGGATTTYCYDKADRLLSSSDPAMSTVTYDARGNTKTIGAQTLVWDGADRHIATLVAPDTVPRVTYKRDALGRIIERKETGQPTLRYRYTGASDSAAFVTSDSSTAPLNRHTSLVGGVLLTKTGSTQRWDYPNIHGDVMVSADAAGAELPGGTYTYEPFGKATNGVPANSDGNMDYGWLGSYQRPLEHAAGIETVEMGARPYVPSIGRFLSVDPVEDGSCNDYEYACGDPVNGSDLTGEQAVFTFVELTAGSPFYQDRGEFGTFTVQFDFQKRALQWSFQLSAKLQAQAGLNRVSGFAFASINNRSTRWHYNKSPQRADYLFHSSIRDFEYSDDAPWTRHRLKVTDTLNLLAIFTYKIPNTNKVAQVTAAFRVGIR